MLNVQSANFIATFITYIIAYIITIPIGGICKAWVTDKMGDSTARDLGYCTLNPLMHFNPMGFCMLLLSYIFFNSFFGWKEHIPLLFSNITYPYRYVKLFLIFMSDVIGHLLTAFACVVLLVATFGPSIAAILYQAMIQHRNVHTALLLQFYPTYSPFVISIATVLIATALVSILLALISFLRNSITFITYARTSEAETDDFSFSTYALYVIIMLFVLPALLVATTQLIIVGGIKTVSVAHTISSYIAPFLPFNL